MAEDSKKWKMARRGIFRVGSQAARRAKETALMRSEERVAFQVEGLTQYRKQVLARS